MFLKKGKSMKNIFQKLTLVMMPILVAGCSLNPAAGSSSGANSSSGGNKSSNTSTQSSQPGSSSSSVISHEHQWDSVWSYDDNNHWHACSGCNEKKDNAAHTMGQWQDNVDLGTFLGDSRYQYTTVKARKCSSCNYFEVQQKDSVLPEVRITFDANDPNADFATKAKSTDIERPELEMSLSITNCSKRITDQTGTIKVRGNQTAGFPKKGFRIKFGSKANLLDLSNGKSFKKWVLMADAKDCTVSRTALGLTMSEGIIRSDSKVWSSTYKPVSVYLNNTYWGMYFLAEQKESKSGRIKLPEVADGYTGTDIGYCFELDHYAETEPDKKDGGDPTFSITYDGYSSGGGGWGGNNGAYDIESSLANPGIMTHFTMNSDITDGPAKPTDEEIANGARGTPVNDTNSNQVKFIKNRLTALFKVLKQAAVDKKPYTINNETNTAVAATGKTIRQCIEENFDLKAWAEGFIINGIACPPDLGYSSFYMSFDNSASGDKKLRFDNPWDFDSNFGNRSQLIEGGDSGSKDPYYLNRTSNMWIQMLSKLDFFIEDYVKPLWNQVRNEKVFEKCVEMLKVYYKVYANEHKKNFTKWPKIAAQDGDNVGTYFNGELRSIFKNTDENSRKNAQKETINWFSKRVNYFENKWGENRPNLPTV